MKRGISGLRGLLGMGIPGFGGGVPEWEGGVLGMGMLQ